MGLDLYHEKAVMVPVDPEDYYAAEILPPEAYEEYGFGRYLQDVPAWRALHMACFYDDEALLEHERAKFANSEEAARYSYWIGTPESNDDALRDLERRLGVARADATRFETWHGDKLTYRSMTLSYSEATTQSGIYYVEVGYQRKGMVRAFYDHFRNEAQDVFVREQVFRMLDGFLDPDDRDELLPNLRENFIDSYERGASFLYVSM